MSPGKIQTKSHFRLEYLSTCRRFLFNSVDFFFLELTEKESQLLEGPSII